MLSIQAAYSFTPHSGYQATDSWFQNTGSTINIHVRFFDPLRGAVIKTLSESKTVQEVFETPVFHQLADGLIFIDQVITTYAGGSRRIRYVLNYNATNGLWHVHRSEPAVPFDVSPAFNGGMAVWTTKNAANYRALYCGSYDHEANEWVENVRYSNIQNSTAYLFQIGNGIVVYKFSASSIGRQEVGMIAFNPELSEWNSLVLNEFDGVTAQTTIGVNNCTVIVNNFGPAGSKSYGYSVISKEWSEGTTIRPYAKFSSTTVGGYAIVTDESFAATTIAYENSSGSPVNNSGRSFITNAQSVVSHMTSLTQEATGCSGIQDFFPHVGRFTNVSARAKVLSGSENDVFLGFSISGTQSKRLHIWGLGPWMGSAGIPNHLGDPKLSVWSYATNSSIASNLDFSLLSTAEKTELQGAGFPGGTGDSALILQLSPGAYSIQLSSESNGSGVGMVAIFDQETTNPNSEITQVSTRSYVGIGSDAGFLGFAIAGPSAKDVVLTAWGSSLFGPSGLPDPKFNVVSAPAGTAALVTNDDWTDYLSIDPDLDNKMADLGILSFQGSKDPGASYTFLPGSYIVTISGNGPDKEGLTLNAAWTE